MRQIGTLDDETQAQRFIDFLKTIDVSAQIDHDDGQWSVWVRDENQLELARDELTKYESDPDAEEYQQVAQRAREIRSVEIQKRVAARKNVHKVRGNWTGPLSKRAPVVMWLIIACVATAIFSGEFWGAAPSMADGVMKFANIYDLQYDGSPFYSIRSGEIWRIVTPIFLHGGLIHIIFNLYWLYILGTQIESKIGSPRFLALILATAVVPNVLQATVVHPNFVGISGVVYGLFGYILVRRRDGYQLHEFTIMIFIAFFVLDFTPMSVMKNVAVWAHAGGMATGALYGYLPKLIDYAKH